MKAMSTIWQTEATIDRAYQLRNHGQALAEVALRHLVFRNGGFLKWVGRASEGLRLVLNQLRPTVVYLPAYTCDTVLHACAGFEIEFVPIGEGWNWDPSGVRWRKGGVAVLTHLFGIPAKLPPRGVIYVEDCAHALGVDYLGSNGVASFFSFGTDKPLNLGGGGLVWAKRPALLTGCHTILSSESWSRKRLLETKRHREEEYETVDDKKLGRLDGWSKTKMALVFLSLMEMMEKRLHIAGQYATALGFKGPLPQTMFPIHVLNPKALVERLWDAGYDSSMGYDILSTRSISERVRLESTCCLPMDPSMSDKDVAKVIEIVRTR